MPFILILLALLGLSAVTQSSGGLLLTPSMQSPKAEVSGPSQVPKGPRAEAYQRMENHDYKDAFDQLNTLLMGEYYDAHHTASDLTHAVNALRNLRQQVKFDEFIEAVLAHQGDRWPVLQAAAQAYQSANHSGSVVAGVFKRGDYNGQRVWSASRDRVRALQLLTKARELIYQDPMAQVDQKESVLNRLADTIKPARPWQWQSLTDISELPDFDEHYYHPQVSGTPVDSQGKPVSYPLVNHWQAASNDGERWHFILDDIAQLGEAQAARSQLAIADFWYHQLAVVSIRVPHHNKKSLQRLIAKLAKLTDQQTIAHLATGPKLIELAEHNNYIRSYRSLINKDSVNTQAMEKLATIYENRHQLAKAAYFWQQLVEQADHSASKQHYQNKLDQIINPWFRFEPHRGSAVGQNINSIDLRYRNAKQVTLTLKPIDSAQLLQDVKHAYKTIWRRQPLSFEALGHRILQKEYARYVGDAEHTWQQTLTLADDHSDQLTKVTLPDKLQGAYVIEASTDDGVSSFSVVWFYSSVIVKKPLKNETLYYVADAATGQPLANQTLSFFGQQYNGNRIGKLYKTKETQWQTDANGVVIISNNKINERYQWLVHTDARHDGFSTLGFNRVWSSPYYSSPYNPQKKAYIITSQPVYRPGKRVNIKAWVQAPVYRNLGEANLPNLAGESVELKVFSPKGKVVHSQTLTTDAYGGVQAEMVLELLADLGRYQVSLSSRSSSQHYGQASFAVEEYKKPEYEVEVVMPKQAVSLGQPITARIQARYYFGAPVTQATVRYTVTRQAHTERWYPPSPWDSLYGRGHRWSGSEPMWYPQWQQHFHPVPRRIGWPQTHAPTEVVLTEEVAIGQDGTIDVVIDTGLAADIYHDTDHRYHIQAEVVDQSRRTITGEGQVIASRHPYHVYVDLPSAYYSPGDTIQAKLIANTVNGQGIHSEGQAVLYKIRYDNDDPIETKVDQWPITTNNEGQATLDFSVTTAGQYRLEFSAHYDGHERASSGLITVIGTDKDAYRFNALELMTDKAHYRAGDTAELVLASDQANSHVLLIPRVGQANYAEVQAVSLNDKTHSVSLPLTYKDMPNIFVEAIAIIDGELHTEVRELFIPPIDQSLTVDLSTDQSHYQPGDKANITINLRDADGQPFEGTTTIVMFDKALEAIAGANSKDIHAFFWDWKRHYHSNIIESNQQQFYNLTQNDAPSMQGIGRFSEQLTSLSLRKHSVRHFRETASVSAETMGDAMAVAAPAASAPSHSPAPLNMRSAFADLALWKATVTLDSSGQASLSVTLPDNLTTWKATAWGVGTAGEVGQASHDIVTKKPVLVRLQAPRFLVENDQLTLSANVHNDSDKEETLTVSLALSEHAELRSPPAKTIIIPPGGEQRVDWQARALKAGELSLTLKAEGRYHSDGLIDTRPVYVRGQLVTDSVSGVMSSKTSEARVPLTVPSERQAEHTRLTVHYSPTLALPLINALPYLSEYPYGCTEQTLSRFLPTLKVQRLLQTMDIDLALAAKQQAIHPSKQANPVFDEKEVSTMVQVGLRRLYSMQVSDGGWGWFGGWGASSSPHTTAYTVLGLLDAQKAGISVDQEAINRGVQWLVANQAARLNDITKRDKSVRDIDAMIALVLSRADRHQAKMLAMLYQDRNQLSPYAQAMLAMAFHHHNQLNERNQIQRNLEQFLVEDDENQTAYLDLNNQQGGWYWSGNSLETQAYYLKLLTLVEPSSKTTQGLAKYLMANRSHGGIWQSTRTTAVVIDAMTDYLAHTNELDEPVTLELALDGNPLKTVTLTRDTLFKEATQLVIDHTHLPPGERVLTITKKGKGTLFYNAYLDNFSQASVIPKKGLEISVERRYTLLTPITRNQQAPGHNGQVHNQAVEHVKRTSVSKGTVLNSGDIIEVELIVTSKNDYEYIAIEDFKAAGFEAVHTTSGYQHDQLRSYREYRDNRVAMFIETLPRGTYSLRYQLKAEVPGTFSALPTQVQAMYAPEIRGNSQSQWLQLVE